MAAVDGYITLGGVPIIHGTVNPTVTPLGVAYPKGSVYMFTGTGSANIFSHNTTLDDTDWKTYQAFTNKIIDINGQGDYTSVADAVTTEPANTLFFIRPGIYPENVTIEIKSGQILIGANKNSVTIELNGNEVLMSGNGGDLGGTIAAGTTGTTIINSNPVFGSLNPGDILIMNDFGYTVDTVVDVDEITVLETINGNTADLVGQDYSTLKAPLFSGNLIEQVTFRIGTGTAFGWMSRIESLANAVWRDVIFDGNFVAAQQGSMRFVNGYNVQFQNVRCINTVGGSGMVLTNDISHNLKFLNCDFENAEFHGVEDTRGRNVIYDGCRFRNCGSTGLTLSTYSKKATVTNCTINGNTGHNISITHITSGTKVYHKINSNQIAFGGADGINISNVQNVTIDHNDFVDNVGDGVEISSTGSIDRVSINNNQFISNGGYGIRNDQAGALKFMYTNNQFDGNATGDILDGTTGAVSGNNQT